MSRHLSKSLCHLQRHPKSIFSAEPAQEVYRISKVVGQDIFTLDFIIVTPVFTDVWEDREFFEWQSKNVQVVSFDGLAKMKQLAGRDQDLLDLKKLGVIEDDSEEDQ